MNKYFTKDTERSILDYLSCSGTTQKNKIYNTYLHPAFTIMAESIIRRYFKGFSIDSDEFFELTNTSISKVVVNLHRFNPDRAKAFSYCQTIIKNYCNDYFRIREKRNSTYVLTDSEELVLTYDTPDKENEESTDYSSEADPLIQQAAPSA